MGVLLHIGPREPAGANCTSSHSHHLAVWNSISDLANQLPREVIGSVVYVQACVHSQRWCEGECWGCAHSSLVCVQWIALGLHKWLDSNFPAPDADPWANMAKKHLVPGAHPGNQVATNLLPMKVSPLPWLHRHQPQQEGVGISPVSGIRPLAQDVISCLRATAPYHCNVS